MSGIEVVGIVLGALPLAISLFGAVEENCRLVGRLVHFEKQYKRVYNNLRHEQLIFRHIVETLIRPLVNDDMISSDDLDRIIENTDDEVWLDQDIKKALDERLGGFHEAFFQVVQDTEQQCMQLLKSLGFDKPSIQQRILGNHRTTEQPPKDTNSLLRHRAQQAYARFDFEIEKIMFVSGKTKQDEFIDCIQTNNRKLQDFLNIGGKVAALRDSSAPISKRSATKHILRYWTHAQRLYGLLQRAWGCQCRDHHHARLYLQHRTSPAFELCLLILFSLTPSPTHAWQEQSLKIEQVRIGNTGNPISIPVPTLPDPGTSGAVRPSAIATAPATNTAVSGTPTVAPSKSSIFSRVKAKVKGPRNHVTIQPGASIPVATNNVTSNASSSILTTPNADMEIQHMCRIISTCGNEAKCLGALKDNDADKAYSVSLQPTKQVSLDSTTLQELLTDTSGHKMWRTQSYAVALAVCSSHLQLQSTAWAATVWTIRDIQFPMENGVPLLGQPYISMGFKDTQATVNSARMVSAERVFTSLGVMLLELCCRKPIEACDWWQILGFDETKKSQSLFRLIVADKWLGEVEFEEGPEMASAIRWCLSESPQGFQGEQWRKDLADKVVLPIQNCCRHLSGNVRQI